MGFAKAFGYGNITQITKNISKAAGFFWFLAALLFIVLSFLFLLKVEAWSSLGIVAAVISQILIITAWKDARFGTVANVLIMLVSIPALAHLEFNRMVKKEVAELLSNPLDSKTIITREMLDSLPPVIQKWLKNSGIVGKEKIQFVRLRQKGEMRTESDGKWMPLKAVQYFYVNDPQFIWQTEVQMIPLITVTGRDKFSYGNGEMLIKLLSLINVSNVRGDPRVNSATMIRYMAETCWFPTAALSDYINWRAIDSTTAGVTMTYKGLSVYGVMKFAENGDLLSFEADRFKGKGKDANLERWFIQNTGFRDFGGIRIPYKNKITWKLKTGDYNWANIELTGLEFNKNEPYK